MTPPLIQLDNVNVALDGERVLHAITWQLKPRQHWAILGANGSGKTTLLKLIRGDLWPAPDGRGRRAYAFDGAPQTSAVGIREKVACVSPELQQRYLQQEWTLTAQQVVHTGFFNTDYLYQKLTLRQKARASAIARLLGIEPLLSRNVQHLSAGQLRQVLIARALAGSPRVLICDELCDGLDAPARAHVLAVLQRLAQNGTQLLFTTHRPEEIFPAITHALWLHDGRIARQGVLPVGARHLRRFPVRGLKAIRSDGSIRAMKRPEDRAPAASPRQPGEVLIDIRHADVYLGRTKVLRHVHWQMRAQENWVILGRNGSGKSTLLKLIAGDLHPAAGSEIQRFRLTARHTLWDLRKKIGVVSAELQVRYSEALTGADVIASGFFSSIGLIDRVTARQRAQVRALIRRLGLRSLARRSVQRLSYGEFRQILLARALVHDPVLLLFDEPFDGLDAAARADLTATLERVARHGTQLILVTHHLSELPTCMTHALVLQGGRITQQGRIER
jgi:molybdate transport system ATP-binding protein